MTALSRTWLALAAMALFVSSQGCLPLPDTADDPPLTLITEIAPTPTMVLSTATRPATAAPAPPGIQETPASPGEAVGGGPAQDQPFTQSLITGPAPYPSPSAEITAWEQLIDPNPIATYQWETYRGELRGNDKSSRWAFTFNYPIGWYADTKSSLVQAFVQNIPLTQGPAPSEFVKFEIVRLTDPPMIEEGHALDSKYLMSIEIAGEPGILYSVTQQADQRRQITVAFQHEAGWLVATGYIALSTADAAALARHTAAIFHMVSSLTFAGTAAVLPAETPTLPSAIQKKPADSDYPAAGICASSEDTLVQIPIVLGNMPDPRCMKVTAGQRLQFNNVTGASVRLQLAQFDVTLQAGETEVFDVPCGDYLQPGVHHVTLSEGSAPEIWITVN